ncbi:uncharacterized protein LOC133202300 [Saccostrea echinata]|uniref:uncharacterized protein LOC133202300 n=1 Tax=Saccostrea echinata TaxID=191078 RepID=UPI002A841DA2|nr:uncharacterized protein LOC133202300 [Saccostrea echinata]
MACCGYASWWAKLSWGCVMLGSLLHVVAWSTPSWMIGTSGGTTTRVGLWKTRTCTSTCTETSVDISYKNDSFRTTQAMETIAFILCLLIPILLGVYVMSDRFRSPRLAAWCMAGCFVTALFLLMGMIAWLVYVTDPWAVSYSFGFSVIALVLTFIAGFLLIPDIDEERSYGFCTDCNSSGSDGRKKPRSVSPDFSSERSFSRNDRITPLSSRSEYDRMPQPMTPVENSWNRSNMSSSATYNNISPITLQRDRVAY